MAGDWIKFDVTTPDKPEVVQMAAALGIDQDAVVGKLLRVWAWADQNTVTCNGECNGVTVTTSFLDRLTFCAGFANAMRSAGWLTGEDGALVFPNFVRHNGKTAKERALSNRRISKHRIGNAVGNGHVTENVTVAPLQKPLPEKRREESKSNTPLPPAAAGGKSRKSERCTYATFVETCRAAGDHPIPVDDPIFTFAADANIPREFIALAWRAFGIKHRQGRKQQAGVIGWRAHFRDAVRGNWAKLWYFPQEGAPAALTTVGIALNREREADAERKAADREHVA